MNKMVKVLGGICIGACVVVGGIFFTTKNDEKEIDMTKSNYVETQKNEDIEVSEEVVVDTNYLARTISYDRYSVSYGTAVNDDGIVIIGKLTNNSNECFSNYSLKCCLTKDGSLVAEKTIIPDGELQGGKTNNSPYFEFIGINRDMFDDVQIELIEN